jgi:hypothetical protein
MPRYHKCLAGCGRRITWRFAICSSCENKYGNSARDWPQWLRYLWNDEQRERRQNTRVLTNEIPLVDLEQDLDDLEY